MAGPIRISILADGKQAKAEFKDTARSGEKSLTDMAKGIGKKVQAGLAGVGKGVSTGVGGALDGLKTVGGPALLAGAAIGGLLIKGLTSAMDLQDARGKLQAQLGLTGKESAKAGKIAGDLYKSAWGDSIQGVNDVLKTVFQSGLASIGDSEAKIKGISEAVFTYSQVAEEEALPATRAVSQMLRNNLAPSAEYAFDILTKGQQLGVNKSEDLLDTFNEYGTQFRKLGLNAGDALGLMNQLIRGGARDSDVAADAIKEFSIRAIDGSTLTAQGFKAIGLNAKTMTAEIGKGGPAARAAFGQTLAALNSIADPVKRNIAGVALFGTQWEDLGGAMKSANLSTAAKSLGEISGATKRAGDAMTTTRTKLTSVARTIGHTLVEAIAKYALPKLDQFVTWFQGPGKFAITAWAIEGGAAIVGFAEKSLGALEAVIGGLGKYAKVSLIAAAGAVAAFSPSTAINMLKQADSIESWAESAKKGIGSARTELQGWSATLQAAKTRVEFEADISDLDSKIDAAKAALANPKLTATRRATLTANIAELERKKTAAVRALGDPKLIATRTAKLAADKRALDQKLSAAQAQLRSKELTKERRATINADISKLQAKRRQAQTELNSIRGVVIPVTISVTATINAAQIRNKVESQLSRYGLEARAGGGPVRAGRTYLVGENGPELVTMGASGFVTPTHKLDAATLNGGGGGGAPIVIQVYALTAGPEVGRATVDAIKSYEQFNGAGWRN